MEAAKAWQQAWVQILNTQHRMLVEFDTLYAPIIGAGEDYGGHRPALTDAHLLKRTNRLATEYDDLKRDLTEELNEVQRRMIDPAQEAKNHLTLMRKTIKKREDRKLDFETYQARVDKLNKQTKLSDRDRSILIKAQSDLGIATEAYTAADENLKRNLPSLLQAVWALQPFILAAQIEIQNNMLAQYYTSMHNYATEEGFPSPSPPMDEVVRLWEDAYRPVQREIESSAIITAGRGLRKSVSTEDRNGSAYANGSRRPSQQNGRIPSASPGRTLPPPPSPAAVPIPAPAPTQPDMIIRPKPAPQHSSSSLLSPTLSLESTVASPPSSLHAMATGQYPAGPKGDYFQRQASTPSVTSPSSLFSSTSSLNTVIAKKKPPPPPPRTPSHQYVFVTALYDFGGQNQGDLAFREGDQIKVIKKTESTDDWWMGELNGVKGQFPANYVQV